jgi:hypothetical protein
MRKNVLLINGTKLYYPVVKSAILRDNTVLSYGTTLCCHDILHNNNMSTVLLCGAIMFVSLKLFGCSVSTEHEEPRVTN